MDTFPDPKVKCSHDLVCATNSPTPKDNKQRLKNKEKQQIHHMPEAV